MTQTGRFTTGSTMRHVIVMTLSGMMGLTFMFLVDAVTLFWVSKLDSQVFMAAMGYAWTVQYFTIAFGVAFMIAATAIVARALGQGDMDRAQRSASVAIIYTTIMLSVTAVMLLLGRDAALRLAGARGETLQVASDFLAISVPSLPIMGISMIASAVLRAEGDALRSMMGTMSAGLIAVVVDPLLIFGFDMGVDGAAWGIVASRTGAALLGLYFVIHAKRLVTRVGRDDMRRYAPAFFVVLVPTLLTQLASPIGNYIATSAISEFGEGAVAGWAVLGRVTVLAFGGVFSLSGAIGGIVGQNYGALLFDRVRHAYRDSLIFSTVYVFVAWGILALMTPLIIRGFELSPDAALVVRTFTYLAAGSYIFAGFLYVSNASFNNLGKPHYSTLFNWIKDGALMYPLCSFGAASGGAAGVIYGQAGAWVIAGTVSVITGWRFIQNAQARAAHA